MIMMFRQASRSFPHDIIEAARLDGLSETGIFFRMYMPTMKSTYAAATIITFMNAWNNYLWPKVILQNNESITMPMLVANLLGGYTVDYGVLMLGVFICTIPTAIIFFCFQKSFTEGITGAVKQVLWIGGRNGAACGKLPSQSERTVEIPLRKELREHDSGIRDTGV